MRRLLLALALLACSGERPAPIATHEGALSQTFTTVSGGCTTSPGAAGLGAAAALIATLAALRLARRS